MIDPRSMLRRARARLADESGFSMFAVMMVLAVTGMFVAGAYAAADGDLPITRESQDRKAAYAAAEGGLNYYMFQLERDPDYWTKCVPAGVSPSPPINQRWSGTGTDPRTWKTLPSSNASYAIELLPANGSSSCVASDQTTMLDRQSGTFRIRSTGRSGNVHRTIVGSFRRRSFLDFLYFTHWETTDPAAYASPSDQTWADSRCAKYRPDRHSDCREIRFIGNDRINGPLHTDDTSILVCGSATFGRGPYDNIEVSGGGDGWDAACSGTTPNFLGTVQTEAREMPMPSTNRELARAALPAYTYTGVTTIRLKGNVMDVTTDGRFTPDVPLPSNGIVYVKGGICGVVRTPTIVDYDDPTGCADVYISGTYSNSLTIASENDIIIRPPDNSGNGDVVSANDAVLGLVANNFVRVAHRVTPAGRSNYASCTNVDSAQYPVMRDVRIDAAILALSHSFIVDNYACGAELGTLTVNGAIAQRFRGPVGTTSGGGSRTGYTKNYSYDDRFRFRSPPFYLNPVEAAWRLIRSNEQVPATAPS
jgi:hypothetical protein